MFCALVILVIPDLTQLTLGVVWVVLVCIHALLLKLGLLCGAVFCVFDWC